MTTENYTKHEFKLSGAGDDLSDGRREHKLTITDSNRFGSDSTSIFLDEAERKALIRALGGFVAEEPHEYWVFDGETDAFWAGSNILEEARGYRHGTDYIRPMYLGERIGAD